MNLLSHDDVRAILEISPEALRRLMGETEAAGILPPWLNVGTEACPRYRWLGDELPRWLEELRAWRASRGRQQDGESAGATPTGRSGHDGSGSSRARTRRAHSGGQKRTFDTSKQQASSGSVGTLLALAGRPTSEDR